MAITEAHQNGRRFKCRACYNAERWLQSKYKKEKQAHLWQGMSVDERRRLVVSNRDNATGRGVKRTYQVHESAGIKDVVKTGANMPFVNRKEFLTPEFRQFYSIIQYLLLYLPIPRYQICLLFMASIEVIILTSD